MKGLYVLSWICSSSRWREITGLLRIPVSDRFVPVRLLDFRDRNPCQAEEARSWRHWHSDAPHRGELKVRLSACYFGKDGQADTFLVIEETL